MENIGIDEVREAFTEASCNRLLSEGWRLLSVQGRNNGKESIVVYVLGRAKPADPQGKLSPAKETEGEVHKENDFTLQVNPPVLETQAPFSSFFIGRICKSFAAKYSDFRYTLQKNGDGLVSSIQFAGVDAEAKKELESTLAWAVKRTLEKEKAH